MIHLEQDEKILYEVRRHWYVLAIEILPLAVVGLLPIAVLIGLGSAAGFSDYNQLLFLSIFGIAAWLLLVWIIIFIIWTNFYLDIWLVTDKRVIDVEQRGLFSREISETRLDKIQDITIEVHGFLPTLLRFGNVSLQTAGTVTQFVMKHAPHPHKIKGIILQAHDAAVSKAA